MEPMFGRGKFQFDIVLSAGIEPLRQIAENSGEEGAIVLGKVNDSKDNNFGYNALTGEYEDLVKAGSRGTHTDGTERRTDSPQNGRCGSTLRSEASKLSLRKQPKHWAFFNWR
jgi:hypothetical protein